MVSLGFFIKNKRESVGYSMRKLSSISGVSDSEIMKIENGERKNPGCQNLCRIAEALDVSPVEIFLKAGYLSENDVYPCTRIRGIDSLGENDIEMVQFFVDFIVFLRKKDIADT